ncbi:hypothetical protein [Paludibacterium purpuratum]|uniref:Uncharacterized protein n=1 Tax=Paludibacterium purpuratum TaxID=1144873 RepID=A0A4R7B3A9_9NEIS|nr:hypothetical protein [Paludibacterium purpuratum]TDR76510.1 hypothetical protein DFP86_11193 [Paludibacterium purpuratum]
MRFLLPLCLLIAAMPCLADDPSPSLSVTGAVVTHQTGDGSTSQTQLGIEALYPTRYGAAYWQDGEGGWLVPAPGGWAALGVAFEPIWSLGGHVSQSLGVARYGFDLPNDGSLSFGYGARLGNSNPGHLFVANLEAPIAKIGRHTLNLWGWASLADRKRRQSLDHQDAQDNGWQLEQSNLMLVVTHPLVGHWTLDGGVGGHWQADQGGHHTAGWQTLVGVTWDWHK